MERRRSDYNSVLSNSRQQFYIASAMTTRFLFKALLILFGIANDTCIGQIVSTFDTADEGWTAFDSNTGNTPAYQSSGGNPGGFIQVFDAVAGTATFYVAPGKFLGDRSSYFDGRIEFDLQVSVAPNSNTAGVVLTSGNMTLMKLIAPSVSGLPAVSPDWTHYSIRLSEVEGWRVGSTTGPVATEAQIRGVLSNLTGIAINGEYNTISGDGGGLDNFSLWDSAGPIVVYNAVSPNGDGLNPYMRIENLAPPDNTVSIFNRWGDLVWEGSGYNNDTIVFRGLSKNGDELPSGTYFYRITRGGQQPVVGYLSLKM